MKLCSDSRESNGHSAAAEEAEVERKTCDYVNLSSRFLAVDKDFSKQYAHIYAARLEAMLETMKARANAKWGDRYPVRKLCDLKEEKEEQCIIIGTLFKHQQLKPSILKELSDELQLVPQPQRHHFTDDTDYLILEDELQRIRLEGDAIDTAKAVTGVVCAILGYENNDGRFEVIDYCWADCLPQKVAPSFEDDRYIVIASGLNFSSIKDNLFAIQLLGDWICGLVGSEQEKEYTSSIVRFIIAGNSVSGMPKDSSNPIISPIVNTISTNVSGAGYDSYNSLCKLDCLLDQLCQSIPVDILPGEFDPTNIMLPQKPMHYCMFPKAQLMNSFNGVPNPYECEVSGRNICGSSGQPIVDIMRYSSISSHLEALRYTLKWGHLAPTAPDTLPCIPSYGIDPFILQNCPDVYFVGNTDKFQTELYKGENGQKVRLVCVPSFAETQTVAIVNLRNLECTPMRFMHDFEQKMDTS